MFCTFELVRGCFRADSTRCSRVVVYAVYYVFVKGDTMRLFKQNPSQGGVIFAEN